jgi:hypothetical protein
VRIDEQPVHDLSAALDDGPDLVAVDPLSGRCRAMADEAGNLLDRDTAVRQQRDEAVPQLARCPLGSIQARSASDLTEGTADVRRIELGTGRRREHEITVTPATASSLADLVLPVMVNAENLDAALRKLKRPTRLEGLGLTLWPAQNARPR